MACTDVYSQTYHTVKEIEVEELEKDTSSEVKHKSTRRKGAHIDQGFILPIIYSTLFNKIIKVMKIIRPLREYIPVLDSASTRKSDALALTKQLEERM